MISDEDVRHIARLARLKITDEELRLFKAQLGKILEYFRKLDELDTSGVEPMKHVLDVHNVVRPDEVCPSVAQEEALKNAPRRQDGLFAVPPVFAHEYE